MHNIGRNDNVVFEKKVQKILGIIYFLNYFGMTMNMMNMVNMILGLK